MRGSSQILATAAVTLCLACAVRSRFVIEQGGLKIKLPASAAAQHRQGFPVSLANFGSPKYGGELVYGPWGAAWPAHRPGTGSADPCGLQGPPGVRGEEPRAPRDHMRHLRLQVWVQQLHGALAAAWQCAWQDPRIITRLTGLPLQSEAHPPFKLNPHTNPQDPDEVTNYVMLVDRGPGAEHAKVASCAGRLPACMPDSACALQLGTRRRLASSR